MLTVVMCGAVGLTAARALANGALSPVAINPYKGNRE